MTSSPTAAAWRKAFRYAGGKTCTYWPWPSVRQAMRARAFRASSMEMDRPRVLDARSSPQATGFWK